MFSLLYYIQEFFDLPIGKFVLCFMSNNSVMTTSVFYSAFRTLKSKNTFFLLFFVAVAKMCFFGFWFFFSKNFLVFQQNVGGGMWIKNAWPPSRKKHENYQQRIFFLFTILFLETKKNGWSTSIHRTNNICCISFI